MKNAGKKFEDNFKKSLPDWCLVIRLPDPAASFSGGTETRFSVKNPCDYIIFNTKQRVLYCLELKSTKQKSISFEDIDKSKQPTRMVHKHQIKGLMKFAEYKYVMPGFVFNFRDEKNAEERTYFQHIADFSRMAKAIGKSSFNESDVRDFNAMEIHGKIKRTNYEWDLCEFFEKIENISLEVI